MSPLTARQTLVLEAINEFSQKNGYPASIRDIANKLNIVSPNGVIVHLKALQKKGYISRNPYIARSIVVLKKQS